MILTYIAAPGIDFRNTRHLAQFGFDDPIVERSKFFKRAVEIIGSNDIMKNLTKPCRYRTQLGAWNITGQFDTTESFRDVLPSQCDICCIIKCCECIFLPFYSFAWLAFVGWFIFLGTCDIQVFKK